MRWFVKSTSKSIPTHSSVALASDKPTSRIESRSNNLNAMRLALATMVMFSHSFALSYGAKGVEPLAAFTRRQETFGSLAVDLFFAISGMLITASWFHSKSMADFLMRRILRIYPGFIVALGFSGALTWLCCPDFRQKLGHGLRWLQLLLTDAVNLDSLSAAWPGTFAHNPFPGYSNGSLWTIPKEFNCYLLVALIGLFCLYKRRIWILMAAIAVSLLYAWEFFFVTPAPFDSQSNPQNSSFRFFAYFLVGMLFWLFRDKIRFTWPLALVCAGALLVASRFPPFFSLAFLPMGTYLALYAGLTKPVRVTRWTEATDISYGIYLYAFPVQQFVAMFPQMRSATLNLLTSVPTTVVLAFLSWTLVEHRFLKMKNARLVDYDPAVPR
jgi:peptidoglycan/LPS O-acetylase OafA/YrhL